MEIDPKKLSDISLLPMCLHINKKKKIHKITNSHAIKDHKKFYLKCLPKEDYEIKTFYAIAPNFRPIPTSMYLFCIKNEDDFPYRNMSLKLIYDPFEISLSNCIAFVAYNLPTPYTIPLYLYKLGSILYPTFDHEPPFPSSNWKEQEFSPIYVLPEKIGNIPGYNVGFSCYDNWRCNPDINSKNSILDCVISCNIAEKNEPVSIFHINYKKHWYKYEVIIKIFIFLLFFSIFIVKKIYNYN